MEQHSLPGARFVDPKVLARIEISSCWRGPWSKDSSTACTDRRTSARRWTSPSIAATCPATTSGAWTGAVRAHGPLLRQGVRGGHQHELLACCSTCRKSMGFASGGVTKLEYGKYLARVPRVLLAAAARSRRLRHVRRRHRRLRAAVGETLDDRAPHAGSREGRAAGQPETPLRKIAENFGAAASS